MKINKKSIALIAGLICLILVVVLLLTMCGGKTAESDPTDPTDVTVPTEQVVDATEEATEPEEEETEPMEDATEPEEETTPTTSGNSRPGGTSGYNPSGSTGSTGSGNTGTGSETEKEQITVSDPGTETNPYTEAVAELPDSFTTVKIPTDERAIWYNVYDVSGCVLTVEDTENTAVVYYNKTEYKAENGVVTVVLEETEADMPVVFSIGTTVGAAGDEPVYTVSFVEALGGASNPEILDAAFNEIRAVLEEGDADGYFYQWTAEAYGVLTIAAESITPEDVGFDVILTNGDETGTVNEDGSVCIDVAQGDVVTIQVVVRPNEDGTYPAAEIMLGGSFAENFLYADSIPYVMETRVLESGESYYYQVFGVGDTIMTIESANAYVIYNGTTYGALDGVVTVPIGGVMGRVPVAFTVGNGGGEGTEAESYTITFAYPEGTSMNPAELVIGQNSAAIASGNYAGYWYHWTAQEDGTLNIAVDSENGWYYVVNNLTTGAYGDAQYSDDGSASSTLSVSKGDEIQINVNTYDPADTGSIPAGIVNVTASFEVKPGSESAPIAVNGAFVTEAIEAGGKVYYAVSGAANMVLTIEDADAYVIVSGQEYRAANGVVTVDLPNADPVTIVVCNGGTEAEQYTVNITEPAPTGEATYKVTVLDYEDNPVSGARVQFLDSNGEVAGEATTNGDGLASAVLERGDYTVVPVDYYYEDSTAVVTAKITTLELRVTTTRITATEFDKTWTYSSVSYGGYNVLEGATYVELVPGTNYFLFNPEEAGSYQILASDPETPISYWGYSTRRFADKSEQLDGYDKVEKCFTDNCFTIDAAEGTDYTYYIGITCEEAADCILVILPVEEETVEAAAETALSEAEETVEPSEPTEATGETVPAAESNVETELPASESTEPTVEPEVTEPAEAAEFTEPAVSTEPTEATEPTVEPTEPEAATEPVAE